MSSVYQPSTLARGWIVVEQPGPWSAYRAADDPGLPTRLRAAARSRGLRLQLIRRFPSEPPTGQVTCLLARVGRAGFVESRLIEDPREILQADLDALAIGARPGFGAPLSQPIYLICTHSIVHAPCGQQGGLVAEAAAAIAPGRVWQTTHLGGCRFAANLVCLPSGARHGQLSPEAARTVVSAHEDAESAAGIELAAAPVPTLPAALGCDLALRQDQDSALPPGHPPLASLGS